MLSVAVDVWIGNAAAVLSGGWGRRDPARATERLQPYIDL